MKERYAENENKCQRENDDVKHQERNLLPGDVSNCTDVEKQRQNKPDSKHQWLHSNCSARSN